MVLNSWLRGLRRFVQAQPFKRRPGQRPRLERLEDKTTPAAFTAATVADLIADINAANLDGGPNTITLVAGKTFTLTAQDNDDYAATGGANGLPVIAAGDDLTIVGSGDIIERSTASGTPAFRVFDVTNGASLTLKNLTLQGGVAFVPGWGGAEGGAIHSRGVLTLNSVTVQNNTAQGSLGFFLYPGYPVAGGSASGGGVYSSGTLLISRCTFSNNMTMGGRGADGAIISPTGAGGHAAPGTAGGNAVGGALDVAAGTATISDSTFTANTAQGGDGGKGYKSRSLSTRGGDGGNGFGGGLYAASGTVTVHTSSVTANTAQGGAGGSQGGGKGQGVGGGIYIDGIAVAGLDATTVSQTTRNSASAHSDDIAGSYQLIL
jgi:hypothetical protein